jgi:hypothetical protein
LSPCFFVVFVEVIMSAFNPDSHKLSVAEWQEIARDTNEETGAQFTVIAGVVLGLLAGAAASPITGLLVAGYFGYKAWQDTQAANRNDAAIASYGCVAHLLKASDLKDYIRQVGVEAAAAEITFALKHGYRVTPAALDWMESQGVDVEGLVEGSGSLALTAAQAQEAEAEASEATQLPVTQIQGEGQSATAVAPNQLEPIATPATLEIPVAAAPSLQSAQAEQLIPQAASASATPSPVQYLMGDRLRTALIVSVSGGGKDILLSNALRAFLLSHPGFRVVVMDCKDDPKEYGYYAGLPNVTVYRLNVAVSSDGEVVEWVDDCVEEFVRLPEKALLICNEGTLIRAKSKRYIQAVDGLVSSGDSRQKYCWEAGQSAHTDDLGINGAARSRFRMLIIGLKGEEMQIEAVLAAKFVADSARNMSDIKGQMSRSPVGRAWCDGQRWFAMPALQNYSGYDRDSRSLLAGCPTPEQQDTRAKLEGLYRATGEMRGETAGEMISPQSEIGETVKRDGETGETPCTASNSAPPDDTVSRFISPGETGETDPDRVRRVCEMKRSGLTQTQILLFEWGVKPGKSQAYLDAVEAYKAIVYRHCKE